MMMLHIQLVTNVTVDVLLKLSVITCTIDLLCKQYELCKCIKDVMMFSMIYTLVSGNSEHITIVKIISVIS